MKKLVDYFISYPVWANVLMFALLGIGLFSAKMLRSSFFPEMESDIIMITIAYPGTSPEEIERGLTLKIEENLRGLQGIEQITSVSSESNCRVTVTMAKGYDRQEVLSDVKNAVDRIIPYPVDAEKPVVYIQKARSRSISTALYGKADLWALKEKAEIFRDDLMAIDGISQVSIEGIPNREIAIEVREADMRRYELTFSQIAAAVRAANLDISGGKLETLEEEILIRSWGRKYSAPEIEKIVLKSLPNGTIIRLRDVAVIEEKWEDSPTSSWFNGERAVIVNIDKTIDEDILFVSKTVKEELEAFSEKYPEIKTAIITDATIHLRERIKLLEKNGIIGFILVVISLGFFLNWRVAGWVALGIPISFAGMFIIASMAGITINVISLFGMIIVVGMLVDDAIVVAENIYQKHEKGISAHKAALEGTLEVVGPVLTAVLTTIFAFLPFFFLDGMMGKFIWHVALVVIAALAFSLIESMLILPAHLAHSKGLVKQERISRFRQTMDDAFKYLDYRLFGPALKIAMQNKLAIVAVPVAGLMLVIGLVKGGFVEISSFPHIDRDNINIDLTLTSGIQEQVTDSILQEIEKKAWEVNQEYKKKRKDGRDILLSTKRSIGSNGLRDAGSHTGSIRMELLPGELRGIESSEITNHLREKVGAVSGAQRLAFGGGGFWGKPVSISLLGHDLNKLSRAKEMMKDKLEEYSSLRDVIDNDTQGKREIAITLLPKAHAIGFSVAEIMTQVRQGFFGQEIQRLQRGNDEIRVWVRYDKKDRASIAQLEKVRIRSKTGQEYPLSELVDYDIKRSVVNIIHLDGKREIRVEADLTDPNSSVGSVMAEIKAKTVPEILSQIDDVRVSYEGRERENRKFLSSVKMAFPLALMGILIILVLVFRSYLQAIIIFLMIPTGLIGAILGHWVHGLMLSRLSMFGIIALTGIVINDSIVYMDQINRNLRNGLPLFTAVYEAGLSRLRPILLTTATTVLGLAPLIAETSRQAQFLIPMAVSIAYGLLFGSLFILFVVPCLFLTLNSIRLFYGKIFNPNTTAELVEPAVKELRNGAEA
ncbi:MAG: efflux RND transporter permease subunit [Fibrobacteria bacterium]|nr:efflux RND transporter permease subunit [Fibrobacteria bacterium]